MLKVKVRDLQPGDYLPATQRTVVSVSRGARTPSRKHDVWLSREGVRQYAGAWGSDTIIGIEREGTETTA